VALGGDVGRVRAGGGADVTLPTGTKVVAYACSLANAGYGRVTIPATSELILADDGVHLRVKEIEVSGTMRIGSESCPTTTPVTVTFAATKAGRRRTRTGSA